MGIPGNEIEDKKATEKYPPQDLINWIKTEDKKTKKARKRSSEKNMKNRKKVIEWNKDEKDEKTR
jgi:hypothetical protein